MVFMLESNHAVDASFHASMNWPSGPERQSLSPPKLGITPVWNHVVTSWPAIFAVYYGVGGGG
jgi:hypothetical protein